MSELPGGCVLIHLHVLRGKRVKPAEPIAAPPNRRCPIVFRRERTVCRGSLLLSSSSNQKQTLDITHATVPLLQTRCKGRSQLLAFIRPIFSAGTRREIQTAWRRGSWQLCSTQPHSKRGKIMCSCQVHQRSSQKLVEEMLSSMGIRFLFSYLTHSSTCDEIVCVEPNLHACSPIVSHVDHLRATGTCCMPQGMPYLHADGAESHARPASGTHALVPAVQAHSIRRP